VGRLTRSSRTYLSEIQINVQPAVEPVRTADTLFKQWAKIQHSVDDVMMDTYVLPAARQELEKYLNRALITQTVTALFSQYGERVDLPMGPVQTVTSVTQIGPDNSEQLLTADSDYFIKGLDDKFLDMAGNVIPAGMSLLDGRHTTSFQLKVVMDVGYGDDADDVPEILRLAVARMGATHNARRQDLLSGTIVVQMPDHVKKMVSAYKRWRI